jgi:hypothetical protein
VPVAAAPAGIVVAAGATTAQLTVTTSAVKKNTSVALSPAYGGTTKTATIAVKRR